MVYFGITNSELRAVRGMIDTWPCQLEEVKLVGDRLHYKRITGADQKLDQLKWTGVRVVRRFLEMVYLGLFRVFKNILELYNMI